MEEKPTKKWDRGRIAHWTFTVLLLCLTLSLAFHSFRSTMELAFVNGTANYYIDILEIAEKPGFDTERVADYMVYAYAMRKPYEPSNGLLEVMLERNEHFAMLAITQRLAKETGKDFGTDFDAWIEHFSSDDSKRVYRDNKEFRREKGIPVNPLTL